MQSAPPSCRIPAVSPLRWPYSSFWTPFRRWLFQNHETKKAHLSMDLTGKPLRAATSLIFPTCPTSAHRISTPICFFSVPYSTTLCQEKFPVSEKSKNAEKFPRTLRHYGQRQCFTPRRDSPEGKQRAQRMSTTLGASHSHSAGACPGNSSNAAAWHGEKRTFWQRRQDAENTEHEKRDAWRLPRCLSSPRLPCGTRGRQDPLGGRGWGENPAMAGSQKRQGAKGGAVCLCCHQRRPPHGSAGFDQ